MIVMLLQAYGYKEVRAAYSARTALESVRDFKPDVVLLDIGMPDTNGYDLAPQIAANCPHCKLVALTGYGSQDHLERARRAGFHHHLLKPVDPGRLERLVHQECYEHEKEAGEDGTCVRCG